MPTEVAVTLLKGTATMVDLTPVIRNENRAGISLPALKVHDQGSDCATAKPCMYKQYDK
jgi:hypothetical protein